jgi:hypothetical protein
MDLKDKIIFAHKGFFNKESEKIYRENSAEVCRISSAKDYIKGLEIDVRKSKDGVVYCYHGTPLEYITSMQFPKTFAEIKKRHDVDTLKDVLAAISPDKAVILDFKDLTITRDDVLSALNGKKFLQVVLANKSVTFLKRFTDMSTEFVKLLNGNALSIFYDFKKLRADNFKYVEIVFPFLVTKSVIKKIEAAGLEFIGIPAVVFPTKKGYWKAVNKYGLKYIPSDFI